MIRASTLEVRRASRTPLAGRRSLPDFLIIGAQKAGTTSLFEYLIESPDVRSPLRKEVHFYDHNLDRGERWYRSNFPLRDHRSWVTGESSPYYLLHPWVPGRVAEHLPDTRLIVLLRDPVARAYSHYQHSRALGREPIANFEAALAAEGKRTNAAWSRLVKRGSREAEVEWFSYARRSRYAPQLRRWLEQFPRESLLILTAEEFYRDPRATVARTRAHIGVDAVDLSARDYAPRNARRYCALCARTAAEFGRAFVDDVAQVEDLMQRPTGWVLGD